MKLTFMGLRILTSCSMMELEVGAFAGQQGTFMKGRALGSLGAEAFIVEVRAFLLGGIVLQLN